MKQNYYLQNTNNEEHIMSKLSTNSSVSQSNQIHYKSMSQLTEIEQENIPVPISSSPIYENNNLSIVQTIQKNQLIKEVKKMKDSIQSIVPESQGSQRSNVSEDTVSEPNFNDVITLQTEDNLLSDEEAIQTSNNTNNIKGTNIMTKSITNSKESINYTGVKMNNHFNQSSLKFRGPNVTQLPKTQSRNIELMM